MKTCTKCGIEKYNNEFCKDNQQKSGLHPSCKSCKKIYDKNFRRKNKEIIKNKKDLYYKINTKEINKRSKEYHVKFPWKRALHSAKQRCKDLNNHRYGGRNIKFKLSMKQGEILWNEAKAWLMKCPSIDRIDNNGDYTFDNCQFIEQSINAGKDKERIILQLTLDCCLIKEWKSGKIAAETLGLQRSKICNVAQGKRNQHGGFLWRYK